MGKRMDPKILSLVLAHYVESSDFNGLTASDLRDALHVDWPVARAALASLVRAGEIEAAFTSHSQNAHIKRIDCLSIEDQVERLASEDPAAICLYPSEALARSHADLAAWEARPYSRRLLLVEAQLTPVFFDLAVLERYFNDPRYSFCFSDMSGGISLRDEHHASTEVKDRDKIVIESFGIAYDEKRIRVVVVFLRYLHRLSPEHQAYWRSHEAAGPCQMNSDYRRATLWGAWPEFRSAYAAFLHEMVEVNRLATIIATAPLFKKKTFVGDRPREFVPMLRPTTRNFDTFVHLMDKLLSDNINRDFFAHDSALDAARQDPKVGTMQLLERWLALRYRDADGDNVARDVLKPFRSIRDLRQRPAHAIGTDAYDVSLPRRQDELIESAIHGLQTLRFIFTSHPKAKASGYAPPAWLDGDKIVFY